MLTRWIFDLIALTAVILFFRILLFASEQANLTSAKFVDIAQQCGIHFVHKASPTTKKYLPETMGSGVALFDYDNDGLLDLYLVSGARIDDPTPPGTIPKKDGPQYWNRLYHQKKKTAHLKM
jgi:hypothetical protein